MFLYYFCVEAPHLQYVNHVWYTAFYGPTLQSVFRTSLCYVHTGHFTRIDTHMVGQHSVTFTDFTSFSFRCPLTSPFPFCWFNHHEPAIPTVPSDRERTQERYKKVWCFPREGAMPNMWLIRRFWSNGTISPFLELPPVFLGPLQRSNFVFRSCIIFFCSRSNDDQRTGWWTSLWSFHVSCWW